MAFWHMEEIGHFRALGRWLHQKMTFAFFIKPPQLCLGWELSSGKIARKRLKGKEKLSPSEIKKKKKIQGRIYELSSTLWTFFLHRGPKAWPASDHFSVLSEDQAQWRRVYILEHPEPVPPQWVWRPPALADQVPCTGNLELQTGAVSHRDSQGAGECQPIHAERGRGSPDLKTTLLGQRIFQPLDPGPAWPGFCETPLNPPPPRLPF